jgi:anthranilate phosphoribosyltransferase
VAGGEASLEEGVRAAERAVDSGEAQGVLDRWVEATSS